MKNQTRMGGRLNDLVSAATVRSICVLLHRYTICSLVGRMVSSCETNILTDQRDQ